MSVMRTEPEPNLVHVAVVGAQKCGTTSLAAVLDRHPQLCLAQGKEAHLFDRADVQRSGVDRDRFGVAIASVQPSSAFRRSWASRSSQRRLFS